jgi:hypothetical protein
MIRDIHVFSGTGLRRLVNTFEEARGLIPGSGIYTKIKTDMTATPPMDTVSILPVKRSDNLGKPQVTQERLNEVSGDFREWLMKCGRFLDNGWFPGAVRRYVGKTGDAQIKLNSLPKGKQTFEHHLAVDVEV